MPGLWLWIVGVALFMPFFLPFYILLRPREAFFYCPSCESKNSFPAEKCKNCGVMIEQGSIIPKYGEWKLSDAISIFVLAVFTLPISLMGISVSLEKWDTTSWISIFTFSFIGSVLILGLPLWFILKVCRRPLRDAGLTRAHLYRNIALGIIFTLPALFAEYVAEEVIVRAIAEIAPSYAEDIQSLQMEEHTRGADILPQNPNEITKLAGAILLLVILAPLGEELLFRGIAYGALKQSGKWRAIIISSILFAMAHMQIIHFFAIIPMGIILAYLYERTGSLVTPITLHISANAMLIFLWYYNQNIYM